LSNKITQKLWPSRLCPGPHWGSLQRFPRPISCWERVRCPLPKNSTPLSVLGRNYPHCFFNKSKTAPKQEPCCNVNIVHPNSWPYHVFKVVQQVDLDTMRCQIYHRLSPLSTAKIIDISTIVHNKRGRKLPSMT